MPQLANAKKALRQSKKRAARNKVRFEEIHSLRRTFRKLMEAGNVVEAKELVKTLDKKLDKAVQKKIVKLNTASRIKSRYMTKLNAASGVKAETKKAETKPEEKTTA